MSQQYPGGLITKNPVVPSGPYQNSTASGVWTLDQAAQYVKAGNWPTAGNLPNYIEDVFSTYLIKTPGSVTPVGAVNNGIDLSTQGGMVWLKDRSFAYNHTLVDTVRGPTKRLISNSSAAEADTSTYGFTAFNTNGFTLGNGGGVLFDNGSSGTNVATWTFRKQPKFFDVVTYTGNGSNRTIAHNLGSVPGCIIVKITNTSENWQVYHRANTSAPETDYLVLNARDATVDDNTRWNDTLPTSTTFSLGTSSTVNGSGNTYVAYLFAHDAGGFGLSGTDNVISCGHYTSTTGSAPVTVTLGYEPQWILVKSIGNSSANWNMFDVMRGWPVDANGQSLRANGSAAETPETWFTPTATGFIVRPGPNLEYNEAGAYRYIYIAIRRGPMKVPTSGTSVYNGVTFTGDGAASRVIGSVGFPPDAFFQAKRNETHATVVKDRLRGTPPTIATDNTNDEATYSGLYNLNSFDMNGVTLGSATNVNEATKTYINWFFRRAPGFFDVVCYTGTGVARTINHNLAAMPELMIVKRRSSISNWAVNSQSLTASDYLYLNSTDPQAGNTSPAIWNSTRPTSTVFSVGTSALTNENAQTFVAYLFATVAGVSKVGSYTGTGTTQVINCGFTAGSRFVMIKRTNSTGDWYVWDSARGIVAGNDPYLLLNSTAAEVTSTDYIDTAATGFEISSTAPAAINANGGTFIFLAIA